MTARRYVLLAAPIAIALLLAGCVPEGTETPDGGGTSSTPTPTASSGADPTLAPEPVITPITLTCDELISPQAMYDFNPNYALLTDFAPEPGTVASEAVALGGLACRWSNLSSGEAIDISVASLTNEDLTARKNDLVTSSNSVPTYDVEGYFTAEGGVGVAQAFSDPYWITATSVGFLEPGEVPPHIAAPITALGCVGGPYPSCTSTTPSTTGWSSTIDSTFMSDRVRSAQWFVRNAVSAASRPVEMRNRLWRGARRVASTTHHLPSTYASATAWKSIG